MSKVGVFSVTFLVTGTTIGAGVLALPIVSGKCGYVVSACVAVISWAIMVFTGYIFVDEYVSMGKNASIGAIYNKIVGSRWIQAIELIYLILFSALLTAYMSGLVGIFAEFLGGKFDRNTVGAVIWLALLLIVSAGPKHAIRGNTLLVSSMLVLFCILIAFCYVNSSSKLLFAYSANFDADLLAVFFGSFGFHGSIPAFCTILGKNAKKSKQAIFYGTLIALVIYLLFVGTILACIPIEGDCGSMQSAIRTGDPIIVTLGQRFNNATLFKYCSTILSVLAITTSFIGVVSGLGQFLCDKFKKIPASFGKIFAMLLPATGYFLFTSIFVKAVAFVGLGCTILFVILPLLIFIKNKNRDA